MKKNKPIQIMTALTFMLFAYAVNVLAQTVTPCKSDTSVQLKKSASHSILTDTVKFDSLTYLSSKLHLTLPRNMMGLTLGGKMKMKVNERIQLSVVMPIFSNELARIEVTPNDVLLIDRYDKLYVQATRAELSKYLPAGSDYHQLEELLIAASKPGGRSQLEGSELGLKSMKDAKVELYDFSTKDLDLEQTPVPTKYKKVTLEEFIKALKGLQ